MTADLVYARNLWPGDTILIMGDERVWTVDATTAGDTVDGVITLIVVDRFGRHRTTLRVLADQVFDRAPRGR